MITSQSLTVPEIHGLILLDCWEPPAHKFFTEIFYVNLIDRLKKYHFKCVVNSPSNTRFDQDDPSLANALQIYGQPRLGVDGLALLDTDADFRRYRVMTSIFKSFTNNAVTEATSALIKKYLLKTNPSIFLITHEDFVYHTNVHLKGQYKNWLVVGQSWQMCTHEHSLGLKYLSQLPGMSFYATDFGFCKQGGGTAGHEDFTSDSTQWEYIENFGYKLVAVP